MLAFAWARFLLSTWLATVSHTTLTPCLPSMFVYIPLGVGACILLLAVMWRACSCLFLVHICLPGRLILPHGGLGCGSAQHLLTLRGVGDYSTHHLGVRCACDISVSTGWQRMLLCYHPSYSAQTGRPALLLLW